MLLLKRNQASQRSKKRLCQTAIYPMILFLQTVWFKLLRIITCLSTATGQSKYLVKVFMKIKRGKSI